MMTDSRIVAHLIRATVNTFSHPAARRDIAQRLRTIRNTSGRHAARLVQHELSARWITNFVK